MLSMCCGQFSSIQVSRRYKHFDWLHERLVEKYCTVAVPPLPEKQIAGNCVFFCCATKCVLCHVLLCGSIINTELVFLSSLL